MMWLDWWRIGVVAWTRLAGANVKALGAWSLAMQGPDPRSE